MALVYVIWGSTYLAIRYVVQGMPALLSGGIRFCVAGSMLLAFVRVRGGVLPTRAQWARAIVPGGLLFLVGNGFVAVAEKSVASSVAAVVCATMPLFATGIGQVLGERASPREWLGLGLGVTGVAVLTAADLRAMPLTGVLLLLAPIGWALGSLMTKRAGAPQGLGAAAMHMITGGVVTTIVGLALGERFTAVPDSRACFAWLYLVIFGSLVTFSAYSYLLRNTTPALATSYAFVNPIIAVLLGVVLGGEALTSSAGLAGALVAAGVALVVSARRAPRPAPAAALSEEPTSAHTAPR